ncbi:response regulator transcription factor [Nocardioides caldifontis]|uniref:response regulator transcription factor n=1 Tax=Nocardioides caldifontis TaxID=2588938 RepID=UPI0011E05829|nr:response regulator transcription factor [Nocardioides caldifontis]
MAHQILMVEDDDGIALPLRRTLEREGYDVDRAATGGDGISRVGAGGVDLVVLDLGLPDMDGLEVCRELRGQGFDGGILILTARGGELDRVVGLDVGADDYLAKPFALGEFLARVRALLRRAVRVTHAPAAEGAPAATGPAPSGLRVDPQARRVWVGEEEVALTSKEFDLLALLDEERGNVLTRERLMDEVWDENWFGSTKTLDVTIGRLRQKLESASAPVAVVTVRGVGFRLEDRPGDA